MSATGHLHPRRDDGTQLDATFELTVIPVFDLVFHHKAGGRGSPRAVNQDYHEALEALLARLARAKATILGIAVDSSVAQELDESARELALDFPIALRDKTNAHELRLEITRAQKRVARRPSAQPGGGNDQKRIRLTLSLAGEPSSLDALAASLVGPPNAHGSPARRDGQDSTSPPHTARDRPTSERKVRTSQEAFNRPIMLALESLGGSASTQGVIDVVASRMAKELTDADLHTLSSGETRWRNTARWARKTLVDAGFLSAASPHGVWELTDAGRKELERVPRENVTRTTR